MKNMDLLRTLKIHDVCQSYFAVGSGMVGVLGQDFSSLLLQSFTRIMKVIADLDQSFD